MIHDELLASRRSLLKYAAGAFCIPFVGNTWGNELSFDSFKTPAAGQRIILIELSGANDGLNTVIPFSDERYFGLRPNLSIANKDRIALDTDYAFHHGLKRIMQSWESGDIAVVHGLGYPKPNRSHFKSIAIWESGGDGLNHPREGWMTHAIEHSYATEQLDAHGISFGGSSNIFRSLDGNWLSLKSVQDLMQPLHSASRESISDFNQQGSDEAIELIRQRTFNWKHL